MFKRSCKICQNRHERIIYDLNADFKKNFFLNALSGMLLLTGAFEFVGTATLQQTVILHLSDIV